MEPTERRRRTDTLTRRGAEWLGALAACAWGAWLLMPGWDPLSRCDHVYDTMLSLARGDVWGCVFLFMGLLKCIALWYDRAWYRKQTALLLGGLWTFVALSVGLAHPSAPSFPVYVFVALQMYRTTLLIHVRQNAPTI